MKKGVRLLITLLIVLLSSGCGKDFGDVIATEPSVKGEVVSVNDTFTIINVDKDDPVYEEYQQLMVSLDVEYSDGADYFREGYGLTVYYDGIIEDGKILHVYGFVSERR